MSTPTPQDGAAAPDVPRRPASPRSPRPDAARPGLVLPGPGGLPPGGLPPGMMIAPVQPRPNIGSMLFMMAFFFFMSGGNNMPVSPVTYGPDGEVQPRMTELSMARQNVEEYSGYLNGTGNWTAPSDPAVQPWSVLPPEYQHEHTSPFFTNITGFYRDARVHPINLLSSSPSSYFFRDVQIPNLNTSSWNQSSADELKGAWDFKAVDKWAMNVKERNVTQANQTDWNWIKGGATLTAGESSMEYTLYGLHHIPNGTYNLFGLPEGMRVDIRNIPRLYPQHQNETGYIILAELEKELKVQEDSLLLSDVQPDDETITKCPLLLHLTLPPIPRHTSPDAIEQYEKELYDPTGLMLSLPRPPEYWQGRGLAGVAVADQCGWAFGIEGGKGVRLDEFWRKSVNYATFASASQLLVLLLLVRQMEATRTPSTLAKVSVWTIIMMGISDSWVFSAHVVIGIMSDNRTSLPVLLPGFFCLCTAIVFAPRYAVLLHRIQAPERTSAPPVPPRPAANTPITASTTASGDATPASAATTTEEPPSPSLYTRIRTGLQENRGLRFIAGLAFIMIIFNLAFIPSLIPIFLFALFSYWVPQIWRNARRGNSNALDHRFVVGTTMGRLALPLYIFGCPNNVFFVDTNDWIWVVVIWQLAQIVMLYAQDRFGPAFFLPKRFAPPESFNYHPLLPPSDPENPTEKDERVCSICMEEVDTRPGASGEVLLGMNSRRAYALAPCHHLFHTKCLSQWLAIKTICPLCKRSLPPL